MVPSQVDQQVHVVAGTKKKVGIVADCGDRTHALTNTRLKRAP